MRRWNLHEVTVSPIQLQNFGLQLHLPHVIAHSEEEVDEYASSWRMHSG
jgi:hypothetical protein